MALELPIDPLKSTAPPRDVIARLNALAAAVNQLQREFGGGRGGDGDNRQGRPVVRWKVSERGDNVGVYALKLFGPDVDTSDSGTLDESKLGTLPDADDDSADAVGWHPPDLRSGDWLLDADDTGSGELIGPDDDGKYVVVMFGAQPGPDTCTTGAAPTVVNAFSTSEAADTGGGVPNTDGLVVTMPSRVLWSTTDGALYVYYRDYTYNSCGKLVSISGETKVNADTAVSGICT